LTADEICTRVVPARLEERNKFAQGSISYDFGTDKGSSLMEEEAKKKEIAAYTEHFVTLCEEYARAEKDCEEAQENDDAALLSVGKTAPTIDLTSTGFGFGYFTKWYNNMMSTYFAKTKEQEELVRKTAKEAAARKRKEAARKAAEEEAARKAAEEEAAEKADLQRRVQDAMDQATDQQHSIDEAVDGFSQCDDHDGNSSTAERMLSLHDQALQKRKWLATGTLSYDFGRDKVSARQMRDSKILEMSALRQDFGAVVDLVTLTQKNLDEAEKNYDIDLEQAKHSCYCDALVIYEDAVEVAKANRAIISKTLETYKKECERKQHGESICSMGKFAATPLNLQKNKVLRSKCKSN